MVSTPHLQLKEGEEEERDLGRLRLPLAEHLFCISAEEGLKSKD